MVNSRCAPVGGFFEEEDWFGKTVTWVAYTNYPAPYWNEWVFYIEDLQGWPPIVYGPYTVWWYGSFA